MADKIDIKALRDSRKWTQQQMADYLGVDRSTVSRIETGESGLQGPARRLLELLAAESPSTSGAQAAE